jgi:choline kinase
MHVVILAAGTGRRFNGGHAGPPTPKCLLALEGGSTILDLDLERLQAAVPEARVLVVTGFAADRVESHLAWRQTAGSPAPVQTVKNPRFEESVVHSVRLALEVVGGVQALLLLNGDTCFGSAAFARMAAVARAGRPGIHLFGARTTVFAPDDMRLQLRGGQVRRVGKQLASASAVSAGAVLLLGSGVDAYRQAAARGGERVPATHHALLERVGQAVVFEDLGGRDWREVDTVADLAPADSGRG